jgi:hypothetical protein
VVGTQYLPSLENVDLPRDYGWRRNMEKSTLGLASLKSNIFYILKLEERRYRVAIFWPVGCSLQTINISNYGTY